MIKFDKNKIALVAIITLFLFIRFWGIGHIYHQDEYRWASIADPFFDNLESPHPPLPEYFYKLAGQAIGFDYLRVVPLIFSFLNLILLYLVVKKLTGKLTTGLIAMALFTVSIYSVIANLQIDIDGALLPFFILLGYYAYLFLFDNPKSKKYWFLFSLSLVGGFLTKLSFLLFLGTIILYFILINFIKGGKSISLRKILYLFIPMSVLAGIFYLLYAIKFEFIIKYAESFNVFNFESRKYFDLIFKIFKSLVWLSPLLLWPLITGLFDRTILKKYGFWYLYILINLIFYIVAFDFTTRTIERYFMFLIMPSIIIVSDILHNFFTHYFKFKPIYLITAVLSFIVFVGIIFSVHQDVLPLDPKIAYVQKVKSFDFNFLIPFSGGSGPSGFYFSAQFILWSWLLCLVSWLVVFFKSKYAKLALWLILVFGVGYNLLFLNEYLGRNIYGNIPDISRKTINYVLENEEINNIITYYDIGAYYLKKSGKYSSRFYTASSRDYTEKLTTFDGYYMIVDFPPIDKNGRYWPLISRCDLIKTFSDKSALSYIFDCSRQSK